MSRYTGPTTRINRRFGMAIFPPTKAFERKKYLPGIHGPRLRRKVSEFSRGLTEKQKLRFIFGLSEKQFRNAFNKAKKIRGITGEIFLRMLELRIDSVVYRLGLARTRAAARQFVCHGHVKVNGHKVDIPSCQLNAGDVIEIRERAASRQLATSNLESNRGRPVAPWMSMDTENLRASVNRLPIMEEMEQGINLQIIVEFYSR